MQNSRRNLFSFLAIALVALSIPITAYIITNKGLNLRISALEDPTPKNIFLSDIKDDSFKVNWMTEKEVIGGVNLETEKAGTVYEEQNKTSFHSVTVQNLKLNTTYEYSILSNGTKYLNNNVNFSVKTSSVSIITDDPKIVYGQVFNIDGVSFQKIGLISLQLELDNNKSQVVTTVLNEIGGFQLDLQGLLNDSLNDKYYKDPKQEIILEVFYDPTKDPVQKRFNIDLQNQIQIPDVYLGDINIDIIPGVEGNVE